MTRIGLLALAASTIAAAPARAPIAFTISSWGHPLRSWTLAPDGSIALTTTDAATKGEAGRTITRHTPPDATRYERIARLLAPLRRRAAHPIACEKRIYDLAYGELRWGTPPVARLRFDDGCTAPAARAVRATIADADRQVVAWADAAPTPPERRNRL